MGETELKNRLVRQRGAHCYSNEWQDGDEENFLIYG